MQYSGELWQVPIRRAALDALGLRTLIVGYDYFAEPDRSQFDSKMLIVLQASNDDEHAAPPGLRWLSVGEVRDADFDDPAKKALLLRLSPPELNNTGTIPLCWLSAYRRRQMEEWMSDEVADRTGEGVEEIEQIKVCDRSAMYVVRTSSSSYYFKAVPEPFRQEPVVSALLSKLFPDVVPETVSIHADEPWMISRSLKGVPLYKSNDALSWKRTLSDYAKLQVESQAHVEELLKAGCPFRPVSVIAEEIYGLMAILEKSPLSIELKVDADLAHSVSSELEFVRDTIAALSDLDVPSTITHGDFTAANVLAMDGQVAFLDWSDATVSFPFFDLDLLAKSLRWSRLKEEGNEPPYTDLNEVLLSYIEPWNLVLGPGVAAKAITLADALAPLQRAAYVWRRYTLSNEGVLNRDWLVEGNLQEFVERKRQCGLRST